MLRQLQICPNFLIVVVQLVGKAASTALPAHMEFLTHSHSIAVTVTVQVLNTLSVYFSPFLSH